LGPAGDAAGGLNAAGVAPFVEAVLSQSDCLIRLWDRKRFAEANDLDAPITFAFGIG
jgi:hypothetical protein